MELNKFEKDVQRKMDELRMKPSDSVWQNIEVRIETNKTSKRMLFLLFLFAFIFLGVAYLVWNNRRYPVPVAKGFAKIISKYNNHLTSFVEHKHSFSQIKSASEIHKNFQYKEPGSADSKIDFQTYTNYSFHKKMKSENVLLMKKISIMPDEKNNKNISQQLNNNFDKIHRVESDSEYKNEKTADSTNSTPIADIVMKNVEANNLSKKQKDKLESHVATRTVKNFNTDKWRFGLTFTGGISGLNNFVGSNNSFSYLSIPTTSGSNPNLLNYLNYRTTINKRLGFSFGFIEEKKIASILNISVGLRYRTLAYDYSMGKNDSSSLYNVQNNGSILKVHFSYIDLPADIVLEFRGNKKLPVAWSGGVVVSQLINSNALQFNSNTGNYYHDNSMFNKTQFGLNTSLSVKFFARRKTSLSVGPYAYYGFSQIAKEGLYFKKHFVFTALKAALLF